MAKRHSIVLSNGSRSFAILAGVALCLVSVVYTVFLTTDLASTADEKVLMGVSGVGFEICKFLFLPVGLALLIRGYVFRGLPLIAIGLALVAVSVSASLGFLSSRTNEATEHARVNSDQYRQLDKQLITIDRQIDGLQRAADIDSGSQWAQVRNSVGDKNEQIRQLQQERKQIAASMLNIDGTQHTSAGALFDGLGELFKQDANSVKTVAYTLVAVLLELCGIAALTIAGVGSDADVQQVDRNTIRRSDSETLPEQPNAGYIAAQSIQAEQLKKPKPVEPVTEQGVTKSKHHSAVDPVAGRADTGTDTGKNGRYKRIASAVKGGRLKPSIRAVMKSENVSYPVAKGYFDSLEKNGIVEKGGRTYKLAESA